MARVEEISSSVVVATGGSHRNSILRLDLTPWDLQLLHIDPIQKGLLFHKPQSYETLVLIDRLKNSLSRTLDFFPPLAGRLSAVNHGDGTASFFVDCNNAGVGFVHAVAAATSVSDILEPNYIPEIVASFFPLNGVPNYEGVSKPLLAVKVTELVDGVFVALTANHVVLDGISFWHFFNSWSEISRGSDTISKSPVFEPWFPSNVSDENRPLHIPPPEKKQNPPQSSVTPPSPLLERVFHFSKQTLEKLKARASSEAGSDKISSLQVLSAHLWRSVSRCRYSKVSLDDLSGEEATIVIIVGGRGRIALPEGYFGNAVMVGVTKIGAADLVQKGMGHAAAKINKMVAQHTKEAVIKLMEDWVKNPTFLKKGMAFLMSSSPRHNVYGNDFGWGKPIAVRSGLGAKADGKMTLYPAAEGGGAIDVEVCLAADTLRAIEDDSEFMEAFTD